MSVFESKKYYFREVLLDFFSVKKSVIESHRLLVEIYDEAVISETTYRDWFRRFKNGDFDVEDKKHGGRPKLVEDAELKASLDEDPSNARRTCRIIGSCSINHFHAFKSSDNDLKVRKLDIV